MKRGTNLPPDVDLAPSHQIARCAVCACILHFTTDGNGRVLESCPHCHWGWPLDKGAQLRRAQSEASITLTPAERAAGEAYRIRAEKAAATKRRSDDDHRAQVIQAIRRFVERYGRPPTQSEMGHSGPARVPGLSSRSLVQRLFGSPAHALEAAGFPVAARQSRNTRLGRGMAMRRYSA